MKKKNDNFFGNYVDRYMTYKMQAIRLLGPGVVWLGVWHHIVLLVASGFLDDSLWLVSR